jgi:hypothetical protein
MSIEQLREVLAWCTVINFGILIFWWLMFILAHDFVYRLHSRWFKIPIEEFDSIHYKAIAFYKLSIILFNLVPYIALSIIT